MLIRFLEAVPDITRGVISFSFSAIVFNHGSISVYFLIVERSKPYLSTKSALNT